MSFLAAIGAFAVSVFVLVWAHEKTLLSDGMASLLAIIFIAMGLVYPFYNAHQTKKAKSIDGGDDKADAVDKAVKSLTDAAKVLQSSKT